MMNTLRGVVSAALVLALSAFTLTACSTTSPHPASTQTRLTGPTTVVQRGDLKKVSQISGTLGYGAARSVRSARTGTITKLPTVGQELRRGSEIFRINDRPVSVFYGSTPLFRKLGAKTIIGSDVTMLVHNLQALGYLHEKTAGADTPAYVLQPAIKAWQRHLGVPTSGIIVPGDVQVLPGPGRVTAVTAQVGDPTGDAILSVSSRTKVVTATATADAAGAIKQGTAVTISLPDGSTTAGTITAIGAPTNDGSDSQDSGGLGLTIRPAHQAAVLGYDSAPVTVNITTTNHTNVLYVPIAALLALREGGYAVQLPTGRLLGVKTGFFTDDDAQVTGPGVTAGLKVMTAQ